MAKDKETKKILCQNRKARHEYEILENIEAGIVLNGTEVKSLRAGGGNIKDSYAFVKGFEVYLYNAHISPYSHGNIHNEDPMRPRKLLLHKQEIIKLSAKVKEKGLTIIPLSIYLKGSLIKIDIGLAKGKRVHDKKQAIKERDIKRDMDREVRNY
jgi:SsrA-binding protein